MDAGDAFEKPTIEELEAIRDAVRENIDWSDMLNDAELNVYKTLEKLESDPNDAQIDMDLFEASLDTIIELEGLGDNSDSPIDVQAMKEKGLSLYKKRKQRNFFFSFGTKAASVVVVLFIFGLITNTVFGFNLWKQFQEAVNRGLEKLGIVQDTDKYVYDGRPMTLTSTEDIYFYTGIKITEPKYLPEGYILDKIRVEGDYMLTYVDIVYNCDFESIVLFVENNNIDDNVNLRNLSEKNPSETDEQPNEYICNGIAHYITINFDMPTAVWVNKNQSYKIYGNITENELKKIIESMY